MIRPNHEFGTEGGIGGRADVSVVIPCYRCAPTIGRALASVAAQALPPAEVILVDDGSGDETPTVLRRLKREYGNWVRILELPKNRGAGSARNAGWEAARGNFIAFLDADDAWHPLKIEMQYRFMLAQRDVVLCGHRHCATEHGSPVKAGVARLGNETIEVNKLAILLSNRFITPSVMIRRELPLRFESGSRYMEDHLLWMRVACAGHRVVRLEAELAYIFKAAYGASGVSSELWAMERGSLQNYRSLRRDQCIGWIGMLLLMGYSLLKYCRRLVIVAMRR